MLTSLSTMSGYSVHLVMEKIADFYGSFSFNSFELQNAYYQSNQWVHKETLKAVTGRNEVCFQTLLFLDN